MNWRVDIDPTASKDLRKLSQKDRGRIFRFLHERVANHPNPTVLAKRLTGTTEPLWRFRVGDHRVVAKIMEERLVVLVVEIGHRREIYR